MQGGATSSGVRVRVTCCSNVSDMLDLCRIREAAENCESVRQYLQLFRVKEVHDCVKYKTFSNCLF